MSRQDDQGPRRSRAAALCLVVTTCAPALAAEALTQSLAGTEVVLTSAAAAQSVGVPGVHCRYRVEKVEGDWLWIATQTGDPVGWVKAALAVPAADAVRYFTARIREQPAAAWAYHRRALAWLDRNETDIALADLGEAIRLDPADPVARGNRGLVWLAKREYDRALADYDEAVRLDPHSASLHDQRGLAWAARGDWARALADHDKAVRLDPRSSLAHTHRAGAEARLGRYDRAAADYAEAIRLDSRDPSAPNGLAWLLATCPSAPVREPRRAVALATQANELSGWNDPYHLGTLAAAEAEAGRFDAAIRWQSKALERFSDADPDLPDHRARLELYQTSKPYREGPPHS